MVTSKRTIEQKAKLYDEASKWMEGIYPTLTHEQQMEAEAFFPELKESEGEQSKNWILEYLYDGLRKSDEQFKDQFKCAIAWLEKQGEQNPNPCKNCSMATNACQNFPCAIRDSEQKPVDKVEPKFKIKDKVIHKETGKTWTIHWYLADTNSYYVIDEEGLINRYSEDVLESAEQKPTEWSEEDDGHIRNIIGFLEECKSYNPTHENTRVANLEINWLKSIRPQNHWMPSEEQMNTFWDAICNLNHDHYKWINDLKSLYQDLKKLREE